MSKLEFSRGDVVAGKYEISDKLEDNPLGITYRAKHQKSGKFVRLTMLRPRIAGAAQHDQMLDVYKRLKDFKHSSVVSIGEMGENEGVAYFTAEDFEGQTLRELLTEYKVEGKRLELKEAAQITLQLLEGLQALHAAGFVLRGLRPEYVLVNVRHTGPRNKNFVARVKISGSGFWDLVPAAVLAEDEFARGEAQYLAPEMKSFEPTATPRADVYSAGVMFYELLTGTAPIGTFQMPASVRPDLPKLVNDIVELALANAPDDRYQTASDFMAAIGRLVQGDDVEEDVKRPLITPLSVALGALLLVCVGVILWLNRDRPEVYLQEAIAADTELRNSVRETLVYPSRDELEALMKNHPPNMMYIPAGKYIAGRLNNDPLSLPSEPLTKVEETKPFLIDMFESPNKLNGPPARDVDYETAEKTCAAEGKRLCTAQEWEKACKGPLNSIYAYDTAIPADTFDPEFCGDGLADRGYPAGSREKCKSTYGVYDMSGGFREWTATAPNGKENRRVVKGGLVRNAERGTRCAFTTDEGLSFKDSAMSFRCCRDADAPPWTPPAPVADPK